MYEKLLSEKFSEVSKVAQLVQALVTEARQPELHLSDPCKEGREEEDNKSHNLFSDSACTLWYVGSYSHIPKAS